MKEKEVAAKCESSRLPVCSTALPSYIQPNARVRYGLDDADGHQEGQCDEDCDEEAPDLARRRGVR